MSCLGETEAISPKLRLLLHRPVALLLNRLPPPPAIVADIGGGPGRYGLWLAELGYQVLHRDLMPLHVEQFQHRARGNL